MTYKLYNYSIDLHAKQNIIFVYYMCVHCMLVFLLLGQESSGGTAPGVYLREDPIVGTQLENQSELRAATADRAAYYLDAAIAARTIPGWYSYITS